MSPKTSLGVKNLFKPTVPQINVSKQKNKHTRQQVNQPAPYKRQTYHLRSDQIRKIKEYAFFNDTEHSEVVRRALDKFLGKWKSPIQVKK